MRTQSCVFEAVENLPFQPTFSRRVQKRLDRTTRIVEIDRRVDTIPTTSREEAISLCESLQTAGGDCFVRRQP